MKIFIVDTKNTKIPIDINENDTVDVLKEKIKNKMGVNRDIILHMNGQIFENNQELKNYDIEDNCVVTYTLQFRGGRLNKVY